MDIIDSNKVIKAYNISNVYLPTSVLIPCDRLGDTVDYKNFNKIHYTQGKILGYPSNNPLHELKYLSAYYKVVKKEG